MSIHYRLDATAAQIAPHFAADAGKDPWDGGDIAPGQYAPIIITGKYGRRLAPVHWGYPPPSGGMAIVAHVRNLESPYWIGNLRHSELRCLVPLTSLHIVTGAKRDRRAHNLTVRSQTMQPQPIFAIAGIWRDLTDMPVFATISTEPNALFKSIHASAMPAIIESGDYDRWLNADWKEAQKLIAPFPSQYMEMDGG